MNKVFSNYLELFDVSYHYKNKSEKVKIFENLSKEEIYDHRKSKFLKIGRGQGFSKSSNLDGSGLSYKDSNIQKFVSHLGRNKLIYAGIAVLAITSLIALIY